MRFLIQRYLASHFILPLVVSTFFFVSILLTFDMFKLVGILASKEIEIVFLLAFLTDLALTFVPLALPLSTFFSVIFCLNKLSSDSEYIAMRAAGMTKGKILMPFMIISLGVSIAIYLVAQNITPYTNRDFKKKLQFLTSSGLISEIKEGQFFTLIPRLTLFSSKVSDKGKTLKNVFLRLEDDKGDKVIFSQNGTLLYERDQKTLVESLKLQLFDGNIITQKNQSPEIEKIVFKSYLLPITQSKFSNKITPRETMLNGNELAQAIKLTQDQAKEKNRFNQKDRFNAFYEYWNRKNVPLLILLMTFLGFSLGIKENRGKSKNSAVMALLCLVFYYTLLFSLVSIARSGKIPVHLSMVIPNILIFSFALFQYKKLDWQ